MEATAGVKHRTSVRNRNKLIVHYRDYVERVAKSLIHSMNLPAKLLDEMVSAGYLGLVEAAERYDFSRGHDFKTFAFLRVRGAIIDSIRECCELSGRAYRKARAYAAALELRESMDLDGSYHGRSGDSRAEALAGILDYAVQGAFIFRLSLTDAEREVNAIPHEGGGPEEAVQQWQRTRDFQRLLSKLPPKERLIIEEHYFRERSLADIGREHGGMSKSWVCRLHARALRRLKELYDAQQKP